jgi:hypothetical protein
MEQCALQKYSPTFYDKKEFLALSTDTIARLVQDVGKPKVGIYIPDGNRRLVLAETGLRENSDEFLVQVALIQSSRCLDNLKMLFGHGLPVLFMPIFSRTVLTRASNYRHLTALRTLDIMMNSNEWTEFYNVMDVRVSVYGDLSALGQDECLKIQYSIERVQQTTREHYKHVLFLGIGGEPLVGHDASVASARFYETYQRQPSTNELIRFLYGKDIPPAEFLIMSSKLGGLGALPAFVCNGDTHIYYLLAPGVMALNVQTFRNILYDLLYVQESKQDEHGYALSQDERDELRAWYTNQAEVVIGLGERIGSVVVPIVARG